MITVSRVDQSCATSGSSDSAPTLVSGLLSDNSELYPAQPGILLAVSPASILDKTVATIHPITNFYM